MTTEFLDRILYTSPRTGDKYICEPTSFGGWFRYDIYRAGHPQTMVQFALSKDKIADSVEHLETKDIYPDVSSRYD